MIIACRTTEKTVITVQSYIVYYNCAQSYAHKYEQFLQMTTNISIRFNFCAFYGSAYLSQLGPVYLCYTVVFFVFFEYIPWLSLTVIIIAIDCLEKLRSEMTCNVSSAMLNPANITHSLATT